jgi:hypothetical protein
MIRSNDLNWENKRRDFPHGSGGRPLSPSDMTELKLLDDSS